MSVTLFDLILQQVSTLAFFISVMQAFKIAAYFLVDAVSQLHSSWFKQDTDLPRVHQMLRPELSPMGLQFNGVT